MTVIPPPSISQRSPESSEERAKKLDLWLARLVAKLYLARAIRTHSDRIAFFRHEIRDITREQGIIAWNWILYGDWTFKGSGPTLELSDFFPTEKQVEEVRTKLKGQGLRIMTPRELERELQIHYNAGHADGYAEACRLMEGQREVSQMLKDLHGQMEGGEDEQD
jgi:hypothetical protein